MTPVRLALACIAIASPLLFAPPAVAQPTSTADRPQVLILGTFHFANPGLDVSKVEIADVLLPAKQAEIAEVVEALARFRPTKIAVERPPASAPRLDSLYAAYRAGGHELTRDETQQLGFRLAAWLDHPRVYPIDHRTEFPFEAMMEYAQVHDTVFVSFVGEELARMAEETARQHDELTVGEILRLNNEPESLAYDHGTYMRFSRVGAGDTYVGADLVAAWYDRNIRIFSDLQRIAEPGDRILVIFGTGHAPILRELVTSDPGLELVEAVDYLDSF